MRVAFVSMETAHQHDAVGHHRFERVARNLNRRSHHAKVFCSQWWDDYTDEYVVDDLPYHGVTLGTAVSSFVARLPILLARYRPDVIHVQPSPPEQVVAALVGGTLARAPVAVEWYGDEEPPADNRFTRWTFTRPARIITPSEYVRTRIRELGASAEQTAVIPESIDYSLVESVDPGETIDVAYGHRLDDTANLDDLLLGLAELRDHDWTATVVGDGPRRAEFEEETEKLRLDDRVEFVGDCDREQRIAIYRGAHAFVQTAVREQFPTELLWALAAGCVGIVEYQATSGAHELIENYDRSYRVTSAEQLADAIREATEFEHWSCDDHWDSYSHAAILNRYLNEYRDLQESYGWL